MLKDQRLALALALALAGTDALALGLGGVEVKSKMNEPLDAEILIVSATPTELENLQVRLASPEMFARVGLDRPALVSANLDFSLGENAQGQAVIRVTSTSRLRDPFLNFLIEVEYGRGRFLREYTVLLDPPAMTRVRSAPTATPPTASVPPPATAPALPPPELPTPPATLAPAAPVTTAPQVAAPAAPTPQPMRPAVAAPAPAPSPAAAAASASPAPDRIQVNQGQTLWSVAQQVRPQGVNTNQAMLALQRANPDAFVNDNMNRLKTGEILRIPTFDEFAAVGSEEAATQVRAQEASWRGQAAPQPVAATMPAATTPAAAAPLPRPAAAVDSRLEVVPPTGDTRVAQSGAAAGAEGRELRAEVARAQEQVSTLQQKNRELQSRVADLERIDRNTRQLISLKDSQLAVAQRRLAELEAQRQDAAAAPATAQASDAEAAPAVPPPDAAEDDAVAGDVATGAESSAAPATDPATGDALPPPMVDDEAPANPPRPERPVREPVGTPAATAPPAPVAAPSPWYTSPLILGGAGVVLLGLFGLRRKREADWRPARGGFASGAAVSDDNVPMAAESTEEQRLLDDIGRQPDDLGRHLALVRFYYLERDASGFEGASEAMYAQLGDPLDPDWQQVVRMGRDILPDHPLFAQADDAEFVAALDDAPSASADLPTAAAPADVEWSLPADEPAPEQAVDPETRWSSPASEWTPETPAAVVPASDDEQPVEAASDGAEEETYASDGGDDESAAIKLELALAYLDMGDVEGARGMLQEVVNEGNQGQRSEARRLLDEIR
jgi:pilus assembly protein FimV